MWLGSREQPVDAMGHNHYQTWSVITVLWAMNKHEPVSYAHVALGSWILILEEVAEAQEGQPWGSGSVQLVGRSLPGKLRGAADRQQRHSTDAGGDRKDKEGPHLQLWSEMPVRWVWGSRPDGWDRRNKSEEDTGQSQGSRDTGKRSKVTGQPAPLGYTDQHISRTQTEQEAARGRYQPTSSRFQSSPMGWALLTLRYANLPMAGWTRRAIQVQDSRDESWISL